MQEVLQVVGHLETTEQAGKRTCPSFPVLRQDHLIQKCELHLAGKPWHTWHPTYS